MKARKQCPKCDSLRVGYLEQVLDASYQGAEYFKAATLGQVPEPQKVLVWNVEGRRAAGELEAYVCADCGYFEHYVKSPESVPFERLVGFHWLNPEPTEGGAYR